MTLVPPGKEDEAAKGVPVGPPDLSPLNLPLEIEIRLNNQLFQRKLLTLKDVRRRANEVFASIQSVLRIDVAAVTSLYRLGE